MSVAGSGVDFEGFPASNRKRVVRTEYKKVKSDEYERKIQESAAAARERI